MAKLQQELMVAMGAQAGVQDESAPHKLLPCVKVALAKGIAHHGPGLSALSAATDPEAALKRALATQLCARAPAAVLGGSAAGRVSGPQGRFVLTGGWKCADSAPYCWAANQTIGTLPPGQRPLVAQAFRVHTDQGNGTAQVLAHPDGRLVLTRAPPRHP